MAASIDRSFLFHTYSLRSLKTQKDPKETPQYLSILIMNPKVFATHDSGNDP